MNVQYNVDPYSHADPHMADSGQSQGHGGQLEHQQALMSSSHDQQYAEQGYYGSNNGVAAMPDQSLVQDDYSAAYDYHQPHSDPAAPAGAMMQHGYMSQGQMSQMQPMPESPYLGQLVYEKQNLDPNMFPQACQLLDMEIERLRNESSPVTHRFPEPMFANLFHNKIRLVQKIAMPLDEYPNLNFGGNIIGKSGENIEKLKNETKCKIMVFGRGSINNREKENSLLNSGDPKYAHLCQDLHVHLETFGFPVEAYANMQNGVAAIKKCFEDLIESSGAMPVRSMRGGFGGGGRMGGGGGNFRGQDGSAGYGGGMGGGSPDNYRGRGGGRGGDRGSGYQGRGGGSGGYYGGGGAAPRGGGARGGGPTRGGFDNSRGGGRGGYRDMSRDSNGGGYGPVRGGRGGGAPGASGPGSGRYAPY